MKLLKEKRIFQYAGVFLLVILCYLTFRLANPQSTVALKAGMGVIIVLTALWNLYCLKNKKLNTETLVASLIFAGLVMRIGYMLYTPVYERSYDVGTFSADDYGSAAYILSIIENKALPQSNYGQLYEQPLFYILGAVFSVPVNAFTGSSDPAMLADAAKSVSCIASCFILLMVPVLCDEAKLSGNYRAAATAFTAFNPSYLLGERTAPDMLSALLMTVSLLFVLRWYRNPDWKNTIIAALACGFAVMTKFSALTGIVFALCAFILKASDKESKPSGVPLKSVLFLAVSIPLAFWYSIRNYRLFGQALGYVPDSSTYGVSDNSFWQRLGFPELSRLLSQPVTGSSGDYNMWTHMIKSSLFGDFLFEIYSFIPIFLLLAATALAVPVTLSVVKGIFGKNTDKSQFLLSASILMFMLYSVSLYLKHPETVNTDFRLMVFTAAPAAVLAAKYCSESSRKWIQYLFTGSLVIYSVFSSVMYLTIK